MECEQLYRGAGYNTSGITPDGSKYLRPAPGGSSAFRTKVPERSRQETFLRVARDTTRASAVKGFVFPTRLLDEAGPLWGKEFDIVVV